jgi:hypothetical protein
MKTNAQLILIAALSLTAWTAAGQEDGGRPGLGGPGRGKRLLERFDKDGYGKLSPEEKKAAFEQFKASHPELCQKLLQKFDKNGDGKLDENERAAAKEAFKERFGEMRKKMLGKFDKNGDGKLDENEKEAAKEALKKGPLGGPQEPNVKL